MERTKHGKKLLWMIVGIAVLVVATVVACIWLWPSDDITVSIQPQKVTLEVFKTQQLEIVSQDGAVQAKNVKWSSSSSVVATVSNTGLVTAVSPGEATIKAVVTLNGKECFASAEVTVVGQTVTQIQVGGDVVEIDPEIKGKQFTIFSASEGVSYDMDQGILTLSDSVKQSEIIFAQSMNDPYADA